MTGGLRKALSAFGWAARQAAKAALFLFAAGSAAAFPEADEIAICLGYGVENSDSCVNDGEGESANPVTGKCDGGGDDFYAVNSTFHPYWKARGVYFEVFDWDTAEETGFEPNAGLISGTTRLDNGCVAIPEADLGGASRLAVRMYLDAKLQGITVRVRGDLDSSDDFGTSNEPHEAGASVGGRCGTNPLEPDPDGTGLLWCQPNEMLLTVNSGNDGMPQAVEAGQRYNVAFPQNELGTIMALTQFPVFWWNQNIDIINSIDPQFDPNEEVTITVTHRNLNTQSGCTVEFPCSATGWIHTALDGRGEIEINIQTIWPRYSRKFLVGHEVGHAMEMIWSRFVLNVASSSALFGLDGYDLDDSDHPAACTTAGAVVSHGITTVEHVSAAANEGFAHFFAADVYNDHVEEDGKFNYYKLEDIFGFHEDVYLDEVTSVREELCGGGGAAGLGPGTGVEEDWLRFFWNFHSRINREDGFLSLVDPDLGAGDQTREAQAQDIMLAIHAGAILDVTGGGNFASDAYYDVLTGALCNDDSRLVDYIEKLDVTIEEVRGIFFGMIADYGVWTGESLVEAC